ncbi:MAG: Uma2 family endonuclease [Chloroflexi bacterium]|nr:Uma2 family endonuclease [Chloroflexota bacterium]
MAIREQRFTREDLSALYDQPENAQKRFELLDGEIIEAPPARPRHQWIIAHIMFVMLKYVEPRQMGFVFSDGVSYTLPNGDVLIPNASFVSRERQGWPLPDAFQFAPDLAVEVASPGSWERQLLGKAESYLESGTKIVWIVYPDRQMASICRRSDDGSLNLRKVDAAGALDGDDLLPGFTLPLRDIFPPQPPQAPA